MGHLREEFLGEQASSPWRQFWAGPYLDLPHFYEDCVILPYQRVLEIESDHCPGTAAAPFLARPLDTTVLRDPAVSSHERPEQPGSWPEISPGSLRSLWSWCLLVGVYGVQPVSFVWLFVTPWTAAHQASLSIVSWSLLKLMSIELVMPSNHLILCCPLLLLPSVFPSIRVFSDELNLPIRWPKYWSFSFNISPSNEYSGLISFRMDWLDLLAVHGPLKSLLQHHSLKASVLRCSAFFVVQLSHPYMTTGKTIALTRWTFVCKMLSLLFTILCRFVIAFLPRSKCLLTLWLWSLSAVILEPKKLKSVTVSIFSPSICHEVMGLGAMILVFTSRPPLLWWLHSGEGQMVKFCFLKFVFILFLTVLGLCCHTQTSLVAACRASHPDGCSSCRALALEHVGFSCSAACGIFLDQRLNLCTLHLHS